MISKFAMTPQALAEENFSDDTHLRFCIECLNDLCRNEGVFVDMRDGSWSQAVDPLSPNAKRFLAFARKNRRLVLAPPQLPDNPENEEHWLWEALRLHTISPCQAVISSGALPQTYYEDPVVSIEQVNQSRWWQDRSPSKTVNRTTTAYLEALNPILRHANSLMFIDPYIDPTAPNYRDFIRLLLAVGGQNRCPLIEIHRASWRREGGRLAVQPMHRWNHDFEDWGKQLEKAKLKATVFLWEKMHDRFLISDLSGISVPYGFDISDDPTETTTWSRLGLKERDEQQREFHPASSKHRFVEKFEIGNKGI